MSDKRIIQLTETQTIAADDYVPVDGATGGTKKFLASNLGGKAEVMTEAEWDDLPDSKLTDGKVYALSGVSPSTQDNPLWQKLGFAALDTTADDCSDAINELNTGLTTLNSKSASTIIMGNFTGTIQRLGKLRIISLYNSTDVQAATSKQLEANDYPATNISVGAWLLVDSNNNFGSRYLELSTTGLLSTSGTVVRGGWVMVYYTN